MKRTHTSEWYAALLHPGSIACFALLVFNDHVLKRHYPGWVSGKLSDVACMVLVPFWLHTSWLLVAGWFGRTPSEKQRRRALLGTILLTAAFFASMQTTSVGEQGYRQGLGLLQYPFCALWGWLTHQPVVFRPVAATPDLTDLFCLPTLVLTWRWGTRPFQPGQAAPKGRLLARSSIGVVAGSLSVGLPEAAQAQPVFSDHGQYENQVTTEELPPGREGFYLQLSPSVSVMTLKSEASVVSGFAQPLESTATAPGFGLEFSIGHELFARWVLALGIEHNTFRQVRVHVAGETVAMENFQLETFSVGIVNVVLPFDDLGWHIAMKIAMSSITPANDDDGAFSSGFSGPDLRGPSFGLLSGYEWRVSRRWWLGVAARGTAIVNSDDGRAQTRALVGGLVGTASFF